MQPIPMTTIINIIDKLTERLGRALALASVAIMLLTFVVVVVRYGFNIGHISLGPWHISSIAIQELVIYCHALLFMLASGYTLKHNAHVRVDVFYRNFSERGKAWVNLFGTLLLLFPMCGFILYISLDFVSFSWSIRERSSEAEGLPFIFILKAFIPAMAVLLLVQGCAELLRNLAILRGMISGQTTGDSELL